MFNKCLGCHMKCEGYLFCSFTCCFLAGYGNVREGVNKDKLEELKNNKDLQLRLLNKPPVRARDRKYL